jgi:hypothetical protein
MAYTLYVAVALASGGASASHKWEEAVQESNNNVGSNSNLGAHVAAASTTFPASVLLSCFINKFVHVCAYIKQLKG